MQNDHTWLSPDLMIKILKDVTVEFKNQSYDINQVARKHAQALEKYSEEEYQQIVSFTQLLGATPKYFVELLNEEIISSQTQIITLNSRNWDIAKRIFDDFAKSTGIDPPAGSHEHPYLHGAVLAFINMVAKRISALYQKLAARIQQKMQTLTKTVKKSRMMNNFLLFKIFRELSETIKTETIELSTQTVFRYCQLEIIEDFYKYAINKYETIKLFASMDVKDSLFEHSSLILIASLEKNRKIEILMKEAVNQDGKYAIFVNPQAEHPELKKTLSDYLLFLDSEDTLRIINCKTVRKQWFIIGDLKNNFRLEKMAREYLVEGQFTVDCKRAGREESIETIFKGVALQNFTNLDGVIGRCLYHMKKYTRAADFFQDLSKRAILSKSIEEIMHYFPLIGFLMAAGSFTKAFYRIFSNRFSTDSKKITQLTGFVVKAGATVGASIVGALVGQALIPIPIVGALFGTVVGGFLGEKGCRSVTSMISSTHFQTVVDYLRKHIKNGCYWQATQQFYYLIDVKKHTFENYIPRHMEKDVFVTIVGFVIICFHESTRLTKHNQAREKREEEEEKHNKRPKKVAESQYQKEKDFQDEVQKLGEYDGFQTSFDLTAMTQYLENHNAEIYEHYEVLEQSILAFLSKILPS